MRFCFLQDSKVSGWWFDGAYAPGEQFYYKDGPNFESLAVRNKHKRCLVSPLFQYQNDQ